MSQSLPVKIASGLDAYLENRFQRNFANGVLNLIAFVALVAVGAGFVITGWLRSGVFLLGLGLLSLFLGVWDIWIYRRNLPVIRTRADIDQKAPSTKELDYAPQPLTKPPSIAESTTRKLGAPQ